MSCSQNDNQRNRMCDVEFCLPPYASQLRYFRSDFAGMYKNANILKNFDLMMSAAIRMCEGEFCMEDESYIRCSMNLFLWGIKVDTVELSIKHLKLFPAAVIAAISKLYLSPVKRNKELGWNVINSFISAIGQFPKLLLCPYAVPLVLGFYMHLTTAADTSDGLYYDCRRRLYWLVDTIYSLGVQGLVAWHEIFPIVIDLANQLLDELTTSLESAASHELVSAVSDYKTLLIGVVNQVFEVVNLVEEPFRMPDGASGSGLRFLSLHRLLKNLLNKRHLFYRRFYKDATKSIFDDLVTGYLCMLENLNDYSKIYKGARESFKIMLEMSKITFRALVMRFAESGGLVIGLHNWLTEHKEILGFECRWTLAMLCFNDVSNDQEVYEMLIDRSNLFAESFRYLTRADFGSLYAGKSISIQFTNEEAIGPGVRREWLFLVCKEIFTTQNALFITNPNDRRRFYINPASKVEPKHLDYFRFCGRVVALALMYKVHVGIVLDRVLFMQLAGLDIQLEYIKDTDPTLYHSCKQILDMDDDLVDSDILGLTFTTEYEEFGSRTVVELRPGGGSLKVDSRNRLDYVNALIRSRFCDRTCSQVAHFAKGFEDIMPSPEYMSFFFRCLKLEDLDQMLRGSESDLFVEDWKSHTDCIGYTDEDPQIIWFWKIVDEMDPEQQRHLLFFWTAVKYLSFEGFSGLSSRLEIHRASTTMDHLPTSHTCFNRICLPEYPTYEMMQRRVAIIIQEHVVNSFGNV